MITRKQAKEVIELLKSIDLKLHQIEFNTLNNTDIYDELIKIKKNDENDENSKINFTSFSQ